MSLLQRVKERLGKAIRPFSRRVAQHFSLDKIERLETRCLLTPYECGVYYEMFVGTLSCAAPPNVSTLLFEPVFPVTTPTLDANGVIQLTPAPRAGDYELFDFWREVVPHIVWPTRTGSAPALEQPPARIPNSDDLLLFGGFKNSFLARVHPDGTLDQTFANGGLVELNFNEAFVLGGHSVSVLSNGKIVLTAHPYPYGSFNTQYNSARFFPNGQLDLTFGSNGTGLARVRTKAEYLALLSDSENETSNSRTPGLQEQVPTPGVQSLFGSPTASLASLLSQDAALEPGFSSSVTTQESASAAEASSLSFGSLADTGSPATDSSTGDLDDSSLPDGELGPILEGTTRSKGIAPRITTPSDPDLDALDAWWARFGQQVAAFWASDSANIDVAEVPGGSSADGEFTQ